MSPSASLLSMNETLEKSKTPISAIQASQYAKAGSYVPVYVKEHNNYRPDLVSCNINLSAKKIYSQEPISDDIDVFRC